MSPLSRIFVPSAIGAMLMAVSVAGAAPRSPEKPEPGAFFDPSPPATIQVALPYQEGFESGAPGWSFTGKWHVRSNPQTTRVSDFIRTFPLVALPDAGYWPSADEGSSVLVYSDDQIGTQHEGTFVAPWNPAAQTLLNGGTSTSSNAGEAVSPSLDLTGVTQAQLSLRTWYEIESVDPAPGQFDAMLVGVSVDGGPFVDVGYSGPAVDYNGGASQPATSGGFNLPGVWVSQVFDLSPYAGHQVQLRFRFQTNDGLYNAFRGWFLDDVRVTSNTLQPCQVGAISPPCSRPGLGIQVLGSNFVNGSTVTIGGVLASPSSVLSSSVIDCTVPALAAGTYTVRVQRPDGSSCERPNAFVVDPLHCPSTCSVSQVLPGCSAPGETSPFDIVVLGTDFQSGGVVYLGSHPCPTTFISTTQVYFRVPGIPDGTYPLRFVSPTGLECSWSGTFIVDRDNCPVPATRKTWGQLKAIYR